MAFEQVTLRTAGGQEYGPIPWAQLIQWRQEGRVPNDALITDTVTGESRAIMSFPQLAVLAPPVAVPPTVMGSPAGLTATDHLIPAKNPMALAAYYCGVFGIIPCVTTPVLGVCALVMGIMGLRKSEELGVGRGHAITGIVLGSIETLLCIAGIIFGIFAYTQRS